MYVFGQIGRRVGERWSVPVLLYGAWCVCLMLSASPPPLLHPAHPTLTNRPKRPAHSLSFTHPAPSNDKPLAEVRRGTSYFKGLALDQQLPHADFGPSAVDPRLGVLCCGAVPYVQNYNIRLRTADRCVEAPSCMPSEREPIAAALIGWLILMDRSITIQNKHYTIRALAAQVSRAVRTRDGGPEGVEALTLVHEGGNMEVACNLLDIGKTPPSRVLALAEAAARALGVEVEEAYTIGMTGQEIHAEIERLLAEKVSGREGDKSG
jgi:glutamate formiminotransferase